MGLHGVCVGEASNPGCDHVVAKKLLRMSFPVSSSISHG